MIVGVALLTIGLGGAASTTVRRRELVGIVVAAFGVVDLLTIPFVLERDRAEPGRHHAVRLRSRPSGTPTEPDRTYNPYARED